MSGTGCGSHLQTVVMSGTGCSSVWYRLWSCLAQAVVVMYKL